MFTVTFDEDVKLTKSNFKTVEEFIYHFYENGDKNLNNFYVDFKEHSNEEIPSNLLRKIKESKGKSLNNCTNLFKEYENN